MRIMDELLMFFYFLRYDDQIVEADTSEDQRRGRYDVGNRSFMSLARVAALCNRAEFKFGQVKSINRSSNQLFEVNKQAQNSADIKTLTIKSMTPRLISSKNLLT